MTVRYQGTRITAPPTFAGVGGSAWRVQLQELGQRATPDQDATVGCFLVQAPGAHAFWDHYIVSVVHLRPIVGVKPPVITRAGATHELMIMALNPEQPLPSPVVAPGWQIHFLTPIDVIEQFRVADDAIADKVLELAVRAIVDGCGSPDQDWRRWWTNAIAETAAHFNEGTHQVSKS